MIPDTYKDYYLVLSPNAGRKGHSFNLVSAQQSDNHTPLVKLDLFWGLFSGFPGELTDEELERQIHSRAVWLVRRHIGNLSPTYRCTVEDFEDAGLEDYVAREGMLSRQSTMNREELESHLWFVLTRTEGVWFRAFVVPAVSEIQAQARVNRCLGYSESIAVRVRAAAASVRLRVAELENRPKPAKKR